MTKLLPTPPTIEVETDDAGLPLRLRWRRWQADVEVICNRWRVDDDWWRQSVVRDYYKVRLSDGTLCVIFRDLRANTWHLQRVYD